MYKVGKHKKGMLPFANATGERNAGSAAGTSNTLPTSLKTPFAPIVPKVMI
jgi:hypothetical protein